MEGYRALLHWVDPNPTSGGEVKDRHRFVVITPQKINPLGISMMVPITIAGAFVKKIGLTVPVMLDNRSGVAVCNQVRSFDIQARVQMGQAGYADSLDRELISEILSRVLSIEVTLYWFT